MVKVSLPRPATWQERPSRMAHCASSTAAGSSTRTVARSIAIAHPPATTCQLNTERLDSPPAQLDVVPDSADAGASAPRIS
jgi:hypothetical protein